MTLVSWSPFREFDDLLNRYGSFPRRQLQSGDGAERELASWRPAANISETESEYLIKAELPEVAKEDIDVSVHDGIITIKGERRMEVSDDNEKQHRIESYYGSFSRSFSLPADADESGIQASSKDGILKVQIPKAVVEKPREIEIKVN